MATMPSVTNAMIDNLANQTQKSPRKKKPMPMSEAADIKMDKLHGEGSFKAGSAAHMKEDKTELNKKR